MKNDKKTVLKQKTLFETRTPTIYSSTAWHVNQLSKHIRDMCTLCVGN